MTESFPDCITEKKKLAIPFPGGFTLASGEKLFHIDIAYETWGTLNAQKDNAILIIHALTGDAHAAGRYNGDDEEPGWWDHLIGPGKSIDTEKYFVICSNNLGGCKGSTGPLSINPVSGRIFGADFPEINITDMVNVQKMLLDFFGIARLHAVIGGSMGGMIALEWSLRFPSMVKKCIPVAAALQLSPQALAFDIVGRDLITEDQHWHKGAYHEYNEIPQNGLAQARKIGHITYLSSKTMSNKFGREIRQNWIRKDRHKFHTDFQVESYLEHQGNKFTGRFDANSYLYITLAMDKFDLEKNACSRFAAGQSEFLILSITSDWLFPPEQQLEITRILLKARRHVSYVSIESDYGHDAFLIENESLSKSISAFLNADCTAGKEIPQCRKCTGTLAADDYGRISSFINSGEKVIDIGCGDGSMLCRLRLEKNISPLGIDISIEKIIECLKRGIPCLHLDADIGLDVIANDAFDTAVTHNTLQMVKKPTEVIKEIFRITRNIIIGFPNFGYYECRLQLGLSGRMPVSVSLPFSWHDTPNIHMFTLKDFRNFCRTARIKIEKCFYFARTLPGRFLIALGRGNLGAESVILKITKTISHDKP